MQTNNITIASAAFAVLLPLLLLCCCHCCHSQVITEERSRRTAEYAFEFAYLNNRRRVTAVHKANIMKKGDGMFIKVGGSSLYLILYCV